MAHDLCIPVANDIKYWHKLLFKLFGHLTLEDDWGIEIWSSMPQMDSGKLYVEEKLKYAINE